MPFVQIFSYIFTRDSNVDPVKTEDPDQPTFNAANGEVNTVSNTVTVGSGRKTITLNLDDASALVTVSENSQVDAALMPGLDPAAWPVPGPAQAVPSTIVNFHAAPGTVDEP